MGICFYIGAPEGKAPAPSAEPKLIGLLTERIVKVYEECGAEITPGKSTELAATAHNRIVDETEDRKDRFVRAGEYIAKLRLWLTSKTEASAAEAIGDCLPRRI